MLKRVNGTTVRLQCDQCDYLYINGIGCHETGCPVAKAKKLADEHECDDSECVTCT